MSPFAAADFGSAVLPAMMFLLIPIIGIYVMNKSVMGEIGCTTAMLMLGTSFYLLFVIWKVSDPVMKNVAIFGMISLTVGLPVLQKVLDKVDDKMMEAEQISICYQHIRMNPQNFLAAFRLARLMYARKDYQVAIAIAEHAIPHMSKSLFAEEHREYAHWLQKHPNYAQFELECVSCNKSAPAGALICPHCLGSLHLDRARKFSVVHNRKFQQVVTVYATLLIVLLAIPLVGQFAPIFSVPLILLLLALALWAVVKAFGLG